MPGNSNGSPSDGYRRGVGLMMFNDAGMIFTGRRIDTDAEAWQMPQGGIDPGETPREAALRELIAGQLPDIFKVAVRAAYDRAAELAREAGESVS